MADGIKGALSQLSTEITQAVIKPLGDEVGKVLEVGAQSTSSPPVLDPEQQELKKAEEEKKKQEAQRVIEWNQQLSNDQSKAAEKVKQNQDYYQKIQEETLKGGTNSKPENKNNLAVVAVKKNAALEAMNTRERRKGVGG